MPSHRLYSNTCPVCLSSALHRMLNLVLWQRAAWPRCWKALSREYASSQTGREKGETLTRAAIKINEAPVINVTFGPSLCWDEHGMFWEETFLAASPPTMSSIHHHQLCPVVLYLHCVKFKVYQLHLWRQAYWAQENLQLVHLDTYSFYCFHLHSANKEVSKLYQQTDKCRWLMMNGWVK